MNKTIGINALFLIPNQVGGTEYHLRSFVEYLQKNDKKNEYIIFCNKENFNTFPLSNLLWKQVPCLVTASNRISRILYEQIIFPFLIKKYNCDIVHSFGYFGPLFTPSKHIITVHDANWKDHPEDNSFFSKLMLSFLVENSIKKSDFIITDSDFSKDRLTHYFPQYGERIKVIKAGLDDSFIELAKKRLVCPLGDNRYIMCVSAMYPHKKIPYLLDLWGEISQIDKRIELVLIGRNGLDETAVLNRIKDMPRINYFSKVPFEKLIAFYKHASVFVFPSNYEGFGFPVYEAAYFGIPIFVDNPNMYDLSIWPVLKKLCGVARKDAEDIISALNLKIEGKRYLDYDLNSKELIKIYNTF